MRVKLLIISMVYLLLLFVLPSQVVADGYPSGDCPDCQKRNSEGDCVWDCEDATCEKCTPVGDGRKACLPCWGDPNRTCCSNGRCCDRDECKDCIGDTCKFCGGDPNMTCCHGSCCDKDQCYHCSPITKECENRCDPTESCCAGGPCCGAGQNCCTDYYYNDMLAPYCCGPNQPCCQWHCCDPNKCETCVDGSCKPCGGDPKKKCCPDKDPHYCCNKDQTCCEGECCDPCDCKTCVDGECKVCGGDPNQKCCDGSCCDKVWTKETINSYTVPCSSCSYVVGDPPMCDGTTTEIESYAKCSNVGVGQGEHCECTNTLQTVGHKYQCKITWDVTKMLWCAAQGAWCVVECAISGFDPATCGNCLAGIDCCGGPCGICDFVETCERNPFSYGIPEKKPAFSSFGCP